MCVRVCARMNFVTPYTHTHIQSGVAPDVCASLRPYLHERSHAHELWHYMRARAPRECGVFFGFVLPALWARAHHVCVSACL